MLKSLSSFQTITCHQIRVCFSLLCVQSHAPGLRHFLPPEHLPQTGWEWGWVGLETLKFSKVLKKSSVSLTCTISWSRLRLPCSRASPQNYCEDDCLRFKTQWVRRSRGMDVYSSPQHEAPKLRTHRRDYHSWVSFPQMRWSCGVLLFPPLLFSPLMLKFQISHLFFPMSISFVQNLT